MIGKLTTEAFLDPNVLVGQFGIEPGMRVADFGCGAGHIGLLIAQKVGPEGKVIAVDILEDKLQSIQARAKAAGLENMETKRANLEVLHGTGIADASQDMVVLANILFQSPKKADIIQESVRVLKAGGKIVVVEWKKGAGGFGPPDNYRTAESELAGLFESAGCTKSSALSAGQFHYGFIFTR